MFCEENGSTWDQERDRKPHLSRHDSETILSRVLRLYADHFHNLPTRVVIHNTLRFWPEEIEGFRAALGDIYSFDFLALERRGIRFLRLGKEPPIRGTVIQLGRRNYLVYTRGYIPYLRQYPGARIPNPLEIVEHHGDSAPEKVCSEILALTKLNWNTLRLRSADPITIAFSRQVATIIKELPEGIEPSTKYRHATCKALTRCPQHTYRFLIGFHSCMRGEESTTVACRKRSGTDA